MKRRTEKREQRQEAETGVGFALEKVRQLLLPMVAGMAATKLDLGVWVREVGLAALAEVFEADATVIAGPKGKHLAGRTHHRWGRTSSELPFGGRRLMVERPRVRSRSGQEVRLPSVARFQAEDPLPERVVNQILLGVSTRGYDASLEPAPGGSRVVERARVRRVGTWWSGWARRCGTTSPAASRT